MKRSARPYLVILGLVLSFSIFTLLGTLLLSALNIPQDIIRWVGLVLLVLLGIGMIVPRFEAILEKPFSWIPQRAVGTDHGGFLLGLILGAVYVPCAGPVLAAITVAGATGKIGPSTLVLTISFAVGTAIPLLIFALAGRAVAERVKAFRAHQRVIRIVAGGVMIALAVALVFNVTDVIQRAIPDYTQALNKALTANSGSITTAAGGGSSTTPLSLTTCVASAEYTPSNNLTDCGKAPALTGLEQWFNTDSNQPLTLASLKGKVVLVDFWAYSCINCQRAIAHVEAWYKAYSTAGLVVIGVHTPEYAFEHVADNVKAGAERLGITYPVALDNNYGTWNAYGNESWPADYLIDSTGTIRHVGIGEGDYDGTENLIRSLLKTADKAAALPSTTEVPDATPTDAGQTNESYLGSARANNYYGPSALANGTNSFSYSPNLPASSFELTGSWTVSDESLTSVKGSGIRLNFQADDVYLDVGGEGTITATVGGKSTTYQVTGAPNIYTVFSSSTPKNDTVTITLSPGLSAYSFTFG